MVRWTTFVAVASLIIGLALAASPAATAGTISKWTFDDGTANDTVDGNHASFVGAGVSFVPGPIGLYADFDGSSLGDIRIPNAANLKPSTAISFEAWVQPNTISVNRYYEVYRKEDGGNRHLFSFQEWGTVLSLGLNGYKELDSPIHPAMFEDGQWHHVAATYDSAASQAIVYVDGSAWAGAPWSGAIATAGTAPSFIGSTNGGSEFFNGGIDEVAVHSSALT
ncbi:LamG domain-containing protein, partial [Planctomycetota bacterium]